METFSKTFRAFSWVLLSVSSASAFEFVTVVNSTNTPVPISGSLTTTTPAVTTVTFNGAAQQVTSTYTVVTDTWSFPVNATFTPPALTTVTFNGTAQPVTVSQSTFAVTNVSGANLNVNIAAGSIGNTGFNVNNAPTVVQSTAAVNGSTIAVTNAVGTQLTVVSTGIPVTQLGSWTVGITTPNVAVPVVSTTPTVLVQSTIGVVGTLADNGVASATNRLPTLPAIYQTDYLNGTAAAQGRNGALSQGTDGLLWTANLPALRPGSSYSASTMTIAVAATPTDVAALKGNAVNTTLLYGIRVSCNQTTAGTLHLTIVKRSTAYTGAWSTMTMVPQDSNYAVAQSSAIFFTANPTLGTSLGQLDSYRITCPPSTTTSPNDIYISPADWRMRPIVLRSASDIVAVNFFGDTFTGGAVAVSFDWTEVKTITP